VQLSGRPCACGRSFRWVEGGIRGRADDLTKIRGVLFSPQAVEDIVRSFDQLEDYRIVISREKNLDEVTLEVEAPEQARHDAQLLHDLEAALKLKTKLRFRIELAPEGTLPRQEIKTHRVQDLRQLGGRGS